MLKVSELRSYYGGIQALKGVDLSIKAGALVSTIGANGAGKTTLLKSISGIIRNKSGQITFQGQDITRSRPERIVRLGISQVPEGRQLFGHLTVEDNLDLGAYVYSRTRLGPEAHSKKTEIFSVFPVLYDRIRQLAGTLSGGEQQMLAIGRALMASPKLLLLDEPSMGLAPLIVREIYRVVKRLNETGTTILLVEQSAKAALHLAAYGYVLETGKVILAGPTGDLLANEDIQRAYLGGK